MSNLRTHIANYLQSITTVENDSIYREISNILQNLNQTDDQLVKSLKELFAKNNLLNKSATTLEQSVNKLIEDVEGILISENKKYNSQQPLMKAANDIWRNIFTFLLKRDAYNVGAANSDLFKFYKTFPKNFFKYDLLDYSQPIASNNHLKIAAKFINSACLLDNNNIAAGDKAGLIKIYSLKEAENYACLRTIKLNKIPTKLLKLTDEKLACATKDGSILILDLSKPSGQECIKTLQGGNEEITAIVNIENGIATGDQRGYIKIWDLTKEAGSENTNSFSVHNDRVYFGWYKTHGRVAKLVALANNRLASLILDSFGCRCVKMWDMTTQPVSELDALPSNTMVAMPNGKFIYNCINLDKKNNTIVIRDLSLPKDQQSVQEFQPTPFPELLNLASMDNNRFLSMAVIIKDNTTFVGSEINIWNVSEQKIEATLKISAALNFVLVRDDGNLVAQTPDGLELHSFKPAVKLIQKKRTATSALSDDAENQQSDESKKRRI